MKERIKKLIDYKGITPGDLADILGVQRSNISHILNGRNKPGAVFIEKFLLAFPRANARWLFTGEGPMIIGETEHEITRNELSGSVEETEVSDSIDNSITDKMTVKRKSKILERVILLYSDGTFISYSPG